MKISEIMTGVFFVSFPSRRELTSTFCRVEEYYESSNEKLRGKVFTWSEFIDENMDEEGDIDYFSTWSGFNVPGDVFRKWAATFTDLSERESHLVTLVTSALSEPDQDFYLIATFDDNEDSVEDHEIAHARYYIDPHYRQSMIKLNFALPKEARILMEKVLSDLGYSETVYEDEIQAYLATSDAEYMKDRFGMTKKMFKQVSPAYVSIYG